MGVKILRLWRMIPSLSHFHSLLGNQISCFNLLQQNRHGRRRQRCVNHDNDRSSNRSTSIIKVIKSDGLVKIYDRPIYISELMREFPRHMVCYSHSFYIGQKIPALSEDDQLQLGHNYFLLPSHLFHSVLSFVTISSFFASSTQQQHPQDSKTNNNNNITNKSATFLKSKAACFQRPFDIQKSASGCLRIRISDEFVACLLEDAEKRSKIHTRSQKEEEEDGGASSSSSSEEALVLGRVCNTQQLVKDYARLVTSRRWKPKLETIREKGKSSKKRISSFGIKRSRKIISRSKTHNSSSTTATPTLIRSSVQSNLQPVSTKSPSGTIIRATKSRILSLIKHS